MTERGKSPPYLDGAAPSTRNSDASEDGLLSIIVPSRNQNRFIAHTLDSILRQSYRPIEVIVVDGASTDGTVETLASYAQRHPLLRWISEPDRGPADAVNKGLGMASGAVAAIQSSDDIYCDGAFEVAMAIFNSQPDCGFVIGDYQGIDENGRVRYTERIPDFSWEAYFARSLAIPQSSIFFRMAVAREAGLWNGEYYGCDLDYWLRVLLRTRAVHVSRVLSAWRVYGEQRTRSPGSEARIWHGYWDSIDKCAELAQAPLRVRRLAIASKHLLAMRHHPTGKPWAVRWHLLIGFLLHPTFWRYYPWSILRWLPGVGLWRRARARILHLRT